MFKALFDWLDLDNQKSSGSAQEQLTVPLATSILYYEIIRADEALNEQEMTAWKEKVCHEFAITEQQLHPFLQKVESQAEKAVDYMQFTRLIHENCSVAEKRNILTSLWHLALVDGHLDAHEEHLIRKMADLMYLSHADFIQTKMAAQNL